MLIVRCTEKLLGRLRIRAAPEPPRSTTRLGDWYATYLPLRPSHVVLLVNESTRLVALMRARESATLAARIPEAIAGVLQALGAAPEVVAAERAAMARVVFAKTANRSVLGTMNEFTYELELSPPGGEKPELLAMAMHLGRTLQSPLGYERPAEVARRALGVAAEEPRQPAAPDAEPPAFRPTSRVLELKVALFDIEPEIWRRVQVPEFVSLLSFHRTLQTVMGWENRHLHEFVAREQSYGEPDRERPLWKDHRSTRLGRLLREPGDQMTYRYDFGDGWDHRIVLERVLAAEPQARYPRVTAGARACPPEDCRGEAGYAHLLAVLRNPRHRQHRDLLAWVGGAFDSEAFDPAAINRALWGEPAARLAPRPGPVYPVRR